MGKVAYLRTTVTNQNYRHQEINLFIHPTRKMRIAKFADHLYNRMGKIE